MRLNRARACNHPGTAPGSGRAKGHISPDRFLLAGKGRGINRAGVRGFIMLEVMLGVAIFSIGVLALGECVNHCVQAEILQREDLVARIALSNRMAEIEGGAIDSSKNREDELKGMFKGITIRQKVNPVRLKNEKKQDLVGLYQVDLEAIWKSGGESQAKALSIYVQRAR